MCLQTKSFLQNGKYRVIRVLGQGGFGITYEAEQVALHRRVAIKEFFMKDYCERDETTSHVTLGTSSGSKELVEKFRTKFIREAQMIAGQDHPHIVKIFDVFEENGTAYYVMEFLEGGSLADLVKQKGPMPESCALDYIRQVGDALSHLHSQNCLHFDVKPANILLNRAGKAALIDFGISKHYDEAGSQTSSTPVGISKGYAPLEQYQQAEISTFTPATDIYALGATLYFLLTGETPPSASEVNEDGLPALPPGISITVKDAIVKAMSPRRKDRPSSVSFFMNLLGELSSDSTGVEIRKEPISLHNDILDLTDSEETTIQKSVPEKRDTEFAAGNHDEEKQSSRKKTIIWSIVLAIISLSVLLLIPWNKFFSTSKQEEYITINGARSFSITFNEAGGNKTLNIEKSFSEGWTYTQKPDWCTINTGPTAFSINCTKNKSTEARNAEVLFYKLGSSTVLATLKISQDAAPEAIVATSISMQSKAYIEDYIGKEYYIEYTISPQAAKNHKVRWSSDNKDVATVNSDGTITITGEGKTNIIAKVDNVSAKCLLEIKLKTTNNSNNQAETGIYLSDKSISLRVGETHILKVYRSSTPVEWESDNTGIATVSNTGKVTAIAPGTTSIWAKGSEYLRCEVRVTGNTTSNSSSTGSQRSSTSSAKEMTLSKSNLSMEVGESVTLVASNYGRSLKWESEDGRIATVSQNGVVKAVGVGQTYIWAKGEGGEYRCCSVNVINLKSKSNQSSSSSNTIHVYVKKGDTRQLSVPNVSVDKWETEDRTIATVISNTGVLYALKKGETNVWAWHGGSVQRLRIHVE